MYCRGMNKNDPLANIILHDPVGDGEQMYIVSVYRGIHSAFGAAEEFARSEGFSAGPGSYWRGGQLHDSEGRCSGVYVESHRIRKSFDGVAWPEDSRRQAKVAHIVMRNGVVDAVYSQGAEAKKHAIGKFDRDRCEFRRKFTDDENSITLFVNGMESGITIFKFGVFKTTGGGSVGW